MSGSPRVARESTRARVRYTSGVTLLLVAAAAAIAVQMHAGRLYVRGDLDRARSLGRRAGLAAAGIAAAGAGVAWTTGGLAVAALIAGAGVSALLGGLSGKPRPAAEVALLLLALAAAALAAHRW